MVTRTHEYVPVLKTLFRLMTPQPRSPLYANPQNNIGMSENLALTILFYDSEIWDALEKDLPPYIVRVFFEDNRGGFMKTDDNSLLEELTNAEFTGETVTVELHPMYDHALALRALYEQLRAIGEEYATRHELTVEWDEAYAYIGAHLPGLVPLRDTQPRSMKNPPTIMRPN